MQVTNIPAVAEKSSVKVNLRMNPSLMINVEGAYVLEEWEEEEVIEVPKKEEKKEEPGSSKKEEGEAEKVCHWVQQVVKGLCQVFFFKRMQTKWLTIFSPLFSPSGHVSTGRFLVCR